MRCFNQFSVATLTLMLCAAFVGTVCGYSDDQQDQLSILASKGGKASITVFPVLMLGKTNTDIAEVIGLMLEQAGMELMHVGDVHFKAPADSSFDKLPALFGEFIIEQKIDTEYALYAEYVDSIEKGVQEIRAVIVDKAGASVWTDRQTPADPDFKRIKPANPMMCSHLVSERFKKAISLKKSADFKASQGRMNIRWASKTRLPKKDELKVIATRCKHMKASVTGSTITVFPSLVWKPKDGERIERVDETAAAILAEMIKPKQLGTAVVASKGPILKVKPARNEMQMLWDLARGFRSYIKANPIETDYALYTHYFISFNGKAGAVHTVVCDRTGEWVIVDLQNDHHHDFKSVNPDSLEDCARLSVKRLENYLK